MTVEFDLGGPPVTPRDAATVIPIRDGDQGLEVLFVRRHAGVRFMGGAFVFPGGKLDASDCDPTIACDTSADSLAALLGDTDLARARGLFVAGIRECLEEARILFASAPVDGAVVAAMQQSLVARGLLIELLRTHAITLATHELVPWSRWITPHGEKRRFDARFFIARVPANAAARHDAHETTATLWLTPGEALRRANAGDITLVPPTYRTVQELAGFRDCSAARGATPRDLRPIQPVASADSSGAVVITLPGDPTHPDSAPRPGGFVTRFRYAQGAWIAESLKNSGS